MMIIYVSNMLNIWGVQFYIFFSRYLVRATIFMDLFNNSLNNSNTYANIT